mgnify:FL=1
MKIWQKFISDWMNLRKSVKMLMPVQNGKISCNTAWSNSEAVKVIRADYCFMYRVYSVYFGVVDISIIECFAGI